MIKIEIYEQRDIHNVNIILIKIIIEQYTKYIDGFIKKHQNSF